MYYNVPWTLDLQVNSKLQVRSEKGNTPFEINDGGDEPLITSHFGANGIKETHSVAWLYMVATVSVDTRVPWRDLKRLTFADVRRCHFPTECGFEPSWRGQHPEPVPGYRNVPRMNRLAVNRVGDIYDTVTRKYWLMADRSLKSTNYATHNGPICVLNIHVLVGWTWLRNPNVKELRLVNHLNGNKSDPSVENLEFVTYSRNRNHARDTGLRDDNNWCESKDLRTGEVVKHASQALLAAHCNTVPASITRWLASNNGMSLNKHYDVRLAGGEWTNPTGTVANRYYDIVVDGVTYQSVREAFDALGLEYPPGYPIGVYERQMRDAGHDVEVTKLARFSAGIQVYDVLTKAITKHKDIRTAAEFTGLSRQVVEATMKRDVGATCRGFAFRIACDEPWEGPFLPNHRDPRTTYGRSPDGKVYSARSARKLHPVCGVDRKFISQSIVTGKPHVGWEFWEELDYLKRT